MKANDLRIGNLVLALTGETEYTEVVVKTIFGYGINSYYGDAEYVYDEIKPIPLTEEWLLKFGFILNSNRYYLGDIVYEFINYTISLTADDPYCSHEVKNKIKYVHQLQNLYYALTNQELTI